MTRILLTGCNGKMGQVITRLAEQFNDVIISAGSDLFDSGKNSYPVFSDLTSCNIDVDVIVDFSNPNALESIINYAKSKSIPVVIATTGISSEQKDLLIRASTFIPVFFSANMSLGINLLVELVQKAAKVLEQNFDIEIIEKHHNQKLDAPSGTALTIAEAINNAPLSKKEYIYDRHTKREKRSVNEMGIHTLRGGTIVGEHSVIFAGNDEIIEIKHSAMSKDIFGIGALRSARFISVKCPGFYTMSDLFAE